MDAICPVHGAPFKWVEPGVSKSTGRPYQGFWSCPTYGCKMKPNESTPPFPQKSPQPTPQYVKTDSDKMTKEDWEAKEARTNKNILLQVAFKAAVELVGKGYIITAKDDLESMNQKLFNQTAQFHKWLLSQTQPQNQSLDDINIPFGDEPLPNDPGDPSTWK